MVYLSNTARKIVKLNNYQIIILHIFFIFINRALNEMWKCQNMLRSHVRELLDLHKQPTVGS